MPIQEAPHRAACEPHPVPPVHQGHQLVQRQIHLGFKRAQDCRPDGLYPLRSPIPALPPAIQTDVVDYGTLRSGRAQPGLHFALWGMGTNFALAAAVGLALPGVEAVGFDPASPTEQGVQALVVIYMLLPVVIKLAVIAAMWRFPLTAKRHAVIRRRLAQRSPRTEIPEEALT